MTTLEIDKSSIESKLEDSSLLYLERCNSTNLVAKELDISGIKHPILIVAKEQTSGKGQQGKSWWTGEGSLAFTQVIVLPNIQDQKMVPFLAANVVADCIENACAKIQPKLKWPNDVFVSGKKVAGILVESKQLENVHAVIIGIGINANCDMTQAPSEIQKTATSLKNESLIEVEPSDLIVHISNELVKCSRNFPREQILPQFMSRSFIKIGAEISVEKRNGATFTGNFDGIGTNGELLLSDRDLKKQMSFVSASIIT